MSISAAVNNCIIVIPRGLAHGSVLGTRGRALNEHEQIHRTSVYYQNLLVESIVTVVMRSPPAPRFYVRMRSKLKLGGPSLLDVLVCAVQSVYIDVTASSLIVVLYVQSIPCLHSFSPC